MVWHSKGYEKEDSANWPHLMSEDCLKSDSRQQAEECEGTMKTASCDYFSEKKQGKGCCCCGRKKNQHERVLPEREKLTSKEHFRHEGPSNAFGEIEFYGRGERSRAKYVRLLNDTEMEKVTHLLLEEWGLDYPTLLISVTGGAKDFNMSLELQDMFTEGLKKVTGSADTWVITGGTNTGVMKQVGDALKGASRKQFSKHFKVEEESHVYCIGIATWGIVIDREKLINVKQVQEYHLGSSEGVHGAYLDNNHSHFLLVDHGKNDYGGEIEFRSRLESHISKGFNCNGVDKVPTVLVVVEGGINTILTVYSALTSEPPTPVVIIKDSGRAADLISTIYELECPPEKLTHLEEVVDQANLYELIKETFPEIKDEEKLKSAYLRLITCLKMKKFITICQMEEGSPSLDEAILQSLLKCQSTKLEMLELAVRWNSIRLAMTYIFATEEKIDGLSLQKPMRHSLLLNRLEFVEFLISQGVSIAHYVTTEELLTLYNKIKQRFLTKGASKSLAITKHLFEDDLNGFIVISRLRFTPYVSLANILHILENGQTELGVEHIGICDVKDVLVRLLGSKMHQRCCKTEGQETDKRQSTVKDQSPFPDPYQELFLWAIICNMPKMAMYLLRKGKHPLAFALVGYRMLEAMKTIMRKQGFHDDNISAMEETVGLFCKLAKDLLKQCFDASEQMTENILTLSMPEWGGETCLSLAVAAEFEEFVAQSSCQRILEEQWNGKLKLCRLPSIKILAGLLCPPLIVKFQLTDCNQGQERKVRNVKDKYGATRDKKDTYHLNTLGMNRGINMKYTEEVQISQPSFNTTCGFNFKKLQHFYSAPITKFWSNVLAYLVFLALFASVVLVQLPAKPSIREYILISFGVSLTTEELRQFLHSDGENLRDKFSKWRHSKWNICDFIGIVLFFLALGLRCFPSTLSAGHLVYSLDIVFWIIRLLEIFFINEHLGPYVVMIGKMTIDMMYFLFILAVFLLAYGISRQAISEPAHKSKWDLLWDIIFVPYFQIFGEMFLEGQESSTSIYSVPQPKVYNEILVTFFLGLFLMVANVLLLNLLIAIFNNTYETVKTHSMQLWKFQRYHLIMQYSTKPVFIPPFIIFQHIAELMKFLCQCKSYRGPAWIIKRQLQDKQGDLEYFEWLSLTMLLEKRDTEQSKEGKMDKTLKSIQNSIKTLTNTQLMSNGELEISARGEDRKRTVSDASILNDDDVADERGNVREGALPEAIVNHYHKVARRRASSRSRKTDSAAVVKAAYQFNEPRRRFSTGTVFSRARKDTTLLEETLSRGIAEEASDEDADKCSLRRFTLPNTDSPRKVRSRTQYAFPTMDSGNLPNLKQTLHRKCREEIYPGTNVERFQLPDLLVNWEVDYKDYKPPTFSYGGTTGSHSGPLRTLRNPGGRTGLAGKGSLLKWGANHQIYWIVTRSKPSFAKPKTTQDDANNLEFLAIAIGDKFGIPSGMADPAPDMPVALREHLSTMIASKGFSKRDTSIRVDRFVRSGITLSKRYADDPRNTDEAWIEVSMEYLYDRNGDLSSPPTIPKVRGDSCFVWRNISPDANIIDNHLEYLNEVVLAHPRLVDQI